MARFSLSTAIKNVGLLCFGAFLWSLFPPRPPERVDVENLSTPPACREYKDWNYTWDGGPMHFRGHHTEVRWRTLYFVRHGHYHSKGPNTGHLTDIGKEQARLVGERLASLGLNFTLTQASTAPRAMDTAHIIETKLRGVDPRAAKFTPNPDIREGWPVMPRPTAIYPNRTEKDIEYEKERMANVYMKLFARPPKGRQPDTTELYVCHGNLIAYFTLRSLQVPIERFLRLVIQEASITVIEVNSKGLFKVRMIGDVGHLPRKLWTHQ